MFFSKFDLPTKTNILADLLFEPDELKHVFEIASKDYRFGSPMSWSYEQFLASHINKVLADKIGLPPGSNVGPRAEARSIAYKNKEEADGV